VHVKEVIMISFIWNEMLALELHAYQFYGDVQQQAILFAMCFCSC